MLIQKELSTCACFYMLIPDSEFMDYWCLIHVSSSIVPLLRYWARMEWGTVPSIYSGSGPALVWAKVRVPVRTCSVQAWGACPVALRHQGLCPIEGILSFGCAVSSGRETLWYCENTHPANI